MANRQKVFLIKAENGREAVMRVPVDQYGGITIKGHKVIRNMFYDGDKDRFYNLKYALNLEDYNTADSLIEALNKYKKLKI